VIHQAVDPEYGRESNSELAGFNTLIGLSVVNVDQEVSLHPGVAVDANLR
jgi:hypothetical protein